MITENTINANYARWITNLENYGCYSAEMENDLGNALMHSPYSMVYNTGGAYDGGLIDVVINKLLKFAYDANEMFKKSHPHLAVNQEMLIRVLLLQHIAKAELFVEQTEEWKNKKGELYKFNQSLLAPLKLGERSIYLCQKYGIKLNELEYEAIRVIDKEERGNLHENPLASLVRMANDMVAVELRQTVINENNN